MELDGGGLNATGGCDGQAAYGGSGDPAAGKPVATGGAGAGAGVSGAGDAAGGDADFDREAFFSLSLPFPSLLAAFFLSLPPAAEAFLSTAQNIQGHYGSARTCARTATTTPFGGISSKIGDPLVRGE